MNGGNGLKRKTRNAWFRLRFAFRLALFFKSSFYRYFVLGGLQGYSSEREYRITPAAG